MMHNHSTVLVAAGSLCLTITLVLAWCLAGVRASGSMKKLFPNYQSLLIDRPIFPHFCAAAMF